MQRPLRTSSLESRSPQKKNEKGIESKCVVQMLIPVGYFFVRKEILLWVEKCPKCISTCQSDSKQTC